MNIKEVMDALFSGSAIRHTTWPSDVFVYAKELNKDWHIYDQNQNETSFIVADGQWELIGDVKTKQVSTLQGKIIELQAKLADMQK